MSSGVVHEHVMSPVLYVGLKWTSTKTTYFPPNAMKSQIPTLYWVNLWVLVFFMEYIPFIHKGHKKALYSMW